MPIPMQVSYPLALHLRSPVTYNFLTNETWKPGEKFQEGRSVSDFIFIDEQSQRADATVLFADILRAVYNHPDWSQLYAFFSARYSTGLFSWNTGDPKARTLDPPETMRTFKTPTTVSFMTDPSSVSMPKDLPDLLAKAGKTSRGFLVGPDPQPCAIGPAISVACGPGSYIELLYAGQRPGNYPELSCIDGEYYGWHQGKYQVVAGSVKATKKGGRGRSWAEWAALWSVIADWIYEHDSTSIELLFFDDTHSFKYALSAEEERSYSPFGKIPRKFLNTKAIGAADAIRDVFSELAKSPERFQGIEWDYLELQKPPEFRDAFYARFGRKNPDHRANCAELVKRIPKDWDSPSYEQIGPMALKPCPDSFRGATWEAWLLSIEGGDVVVVETVFQALWAVILLTELPLNIKIIEKGALNTRLTARNPQYYFFAMPPDRSASKTKPFKPQRPSTGGTSSRAKPTPAPSSSRTTATSTETPSSRPNPTDNDDDDVTALDAPTETIPPALLTTLLTEFFADERTRISRGADKAVGKYMETFVREAIARAAFERGGEGRGDGFLEVEDLEKLAPQLVLDF
ncbi:hypothetical protein V492_01928 [Pseudogymnoascus sp. VKM F-4246]|nr:hypothetical protein V492_01928 [Pseudogymnoascus sp. VKM F-4246]